MKRAVLAVVLLWAAGLALAAEPHVEILDNGLTVVVEEDHSAPVATVEFFVGTGSTFEDNYLGSGISHLIEHTLMEGTTTRTKADIERLQTELGNNTNAYTSTDVVGYYIVTSGRQALQAADLVADYVFHPSFPQESVETQRGIILREMARGEDDPGRQIYELFASTVFRVSPPGVRVIGYPEQFGKLAREDLVAHHTRFYAPRNVVAVVVGDVNAEETLRHLRETLGEIPAGVARRPVLPPEPVQTSPRRAVRHQEGLSRAYLMLGYPSVSLFSPDMYGLDVAAYILSNGATSRMVSKLRDERGLVDDVSAFSHTPAYDAGVFAVSAVTSPDKVEAAERALVAELNWLKQKPVTAAELARAKRQKEADLLFGRVTTQGRAGIYGNDLLTTGDIHFSERYVERIRQVTAADVQRVAVKYFLPERSNFALLVPAAPGEAAPSAAAPSPAAEPVAAAKIDEARLPNGLRLLVQENHAVPVVNVFIAVPGGLRFENERNAGITSLLASMLVRGTRTRSRLQIAAALEDVGGSLGPFSGRNSFGLSAQVRAQDLPLALEIAADVLRNPSFPEQELQQQKQLQLAALATREDDVDTVANDLMVQTLFSQYPYRFPTVGTAASVTALTREDLARFHSEMVRPGSMVVAVFGDATLAQARELVERHLGTFAGGEAAATAAASEPPPAEPRLKEVTRPQQQAVLVYGFRSGLVTDPDRYARDVMNAVFSGLGYPGGRLHEALRGQQLVYATHGYNVSGPDAGYFTIYAGTAPDKAGVVQEQIETILRNLQAAPPTPEELALAKNVAVASHAVQLESSGARAQAVALNVLYGLGRDDIFRYADEISKVTGEQVQAQAQKVMDLQRKVLVVTHP